MINNDFNANYRKAFVEWVDAHSEEVCVSEVSNRSEVRILLNPKGENTCPVLIASRNGSTQIQLGQSINFDETDYLESDDGFKLTTVMTDDELKDFLDAALYGRVREVLLYKHKKVIKSSGEIILNGKAYKTRTTTLQGIFVKPDRRTEFTYAAAQHDDPVLNH